MRLSLHEDGLQIIPEDSIYDRRDTIYIERVLGLKKSGDAVLLIRQNAHRLSCIAYLETKPLEGKDDE